MHDNIIRAKESFIIFTYLVGDFMNIFSLFLIFIITSLLALVSRGFSQFHLFKSCLFIAYQQCSTWLIQDLFYDFIFSIFSSWFLCLKYKQGVHSEWVGHVILFFTKGISCVSFNGYYDANCCFFLIPVLVCECLSFCHIAPFIHLPVSMFKSQCLLQVPQGPFYVRGAVPVTCFQWRSIHWLTSNEKSVTIRSKMRTMSCNNFLTSGWNEFKKAPYFSPGTFSPNSSHL